MWQVFYFILFSAALILESLLLFVQQPAQTIKTVFNIGTAFLPQHAAFLQIHILIHNATMSFNAYISKEAVPFHPVMNNVSQINIQITNSFC